MMSASCAVACTGQGRGGQQNLKQKVEVTRGCTNLNAYGLSPPVRYFPIPETIGHFTGSDAI